MKRYNLSGTVEVVFANDGSVLSNPQVEYKPFLVSGAPVKHYVPSEDGEFPPSGTVGAIVSLLDGDGTFSGLGFLTADHVCTLSPSAVGKLGSVLVSSRGHDIAVISADKFLSNDGTCMNLIHFAGWQEQDSIFQHSSSQGDSQTSTFRESSLSTMDDDIAFTNAVEFSADDNTDFLGHYDKQLSHGEIIYKMGSATGLRSGKYRSLYTGEDFNYRSKLSILVEWDRDDHFADNGDCGSVYFYKSGGKFIPLAIHLGSARKDGKPVSVGALIGDNRVKYGNFFIDFKVESHPNYVSSVFTEERESLTGSFYDGLITEV